MSENEIRGNLRVFRDSVEKYYGGNGLAVYASKAFNCKEMCRICAQEGTGIDVVSGGELYTALKSRGILVRHFKDEKIRDFNRITIGTDAEMDALLLAVELILGE